MGTSRGHLVAQETFHVGVERNEETLEPRMYLNKLPAQVPTLVPALVPSWPAPTTKTAHIRS